MKINETAEGVWLVAEVGEPVASNPKAMAVYHYANGRWHCTRCKRDVFGSCEHIQAVRTHLYNTAIK